MCPGASVCDLETCDGCLGRYWGSCGWSWSLSELMLAVLGGPGVETWAKPNREHGFWESRGVVFPWARAKAFRPGLQILARLYIYIYIYIYIGGWGG